MLISDLKLLLRFNSTSLLEEVSQTNMFVYGDDSNILVSDSGYVMQDDQYLLGEGLSSSGYNLNITNAMTFGFWLYSVNSGVAVNEDTGATSSIEKPLFDFIDAGSSSNSVLKITEHTSENTNNYLKISIDGTTYIASSEEYASAQWHYFWIVYSSSTLSIVVDGIAHVLQNVSGSIPSSIDGSNLDLYINHSLDGYAWNIAKNRGIVDDIFILNVANLNEQDIQTVINDGVKFVVDDNFTTTDIDKQSIYFNDPETITISSLIDDMNYIFVGRNDGKIMRGSPLLWEVRRVFSDSVEIEDVGLDPETHQDNGFLKIFNTTIRL